MMRRLSDDTNCWRHRTIDSPTYMLNLLRKEQKRECKGSTDIVQKNNRANTGLYQSAKGGRYVKSIPGSGSPARNYDRPALPGNRKSRVN